MVGHMAEMETEWSPAGLVEYFSVEPYYWVFPDKGPKRREPNDIPTPAGFAASHGKSERMLQELCNNDPEWREAAEIAATKMKYFIQVNGLTKGVWEQTFASLLAKNEIGYTEKVEQRNVGLGHEEALRELIRLERQRAEPMLVGHEEVGRAG